MTRRCTICSHPSREEIDRALIIGGSVRAIASNYSVARSSLERHKSGHLPADLAQSTQAREVFRADSLADQVRILQSKTLSILDKASTANDHRVALQAINVARGNIELLARLVGEIQERSQTVNILLASPQWISLRLAILHALDPYPDARQALADSLAQLEQGAPVLANPDTPTQGKRTFNDGTNG